MPGTSPLRHAPSMAQHRFVTCMTLWYFVALAGGAAAWWSGGTRTPFLAAVAVGLFLGLQVWSQDRLLRRLVGRHIPGWAAFSAAAAIPAALAGALIAAGAAPPLGWTPGSPAGPLLLLGIPVAVWYGTWWAVLRAGWIEVSSALVAAGIHGIVSDLALRLADQPARLGGVVWTAPISFLGGFALLFLPGAVAAHACTPTPQQDRRWGRWLLAWALPGLAAWAVALACIGPVGLTGR